MRLRRSELFVPGPDVARVPKAIASGTDIVILDLEDAVVPDRKAEARGLVVESLRSLEWGRVGRSVRINGLDTPWALDDVETLVAEAGDVLDVIVVPKVGNADEVRFMDRLLTLCERRAGLERRIGLELAIEDAAALTRVEEIARAAPGRAEAVMFGIGDFSTSLGFRWGAPAVLSYPGDAYHSIRSRIAIAARAAGLDAVDGPWMRIKDIAGLEDELTRSVALGFGGKAVIHPTHVEPTNRILSPSPEEVAEATELLAAYEAARAEGRAAVQVKGALMDEAMIPMMRNIIARGNATAR
ncbi:MAG: CoA ester lyase [Acidimicrobiia bacterium]|nr:CoA ester lyase [Acidimicrobiia bacterium]